MFGIGSVLRDGDGSIQDRIPYMQSHALGTDSKNPWPKPIEQQRKYLRLYAAHKARVICRNGCAL